MRQGTIAGLVALAALAVPGAAAGAPGQLRAAQRGGRWVTTSSHGIAAFPSEVTKQMGERIRRAALARSGGAVERIALAGLTNGYLSYTATPEEYDACYYEGSFTLFGRRQGPRYLGAATGLAASLFDGASLPAGASEPPSLAFGASGLPPRRTPDAGQVVREPAAAVPRLGRAVLAWRGGDPSVEAPRGRALVTLERRSGSSWQAVGTEEGFFDTTERGSDDVWTETWQFTACDPVGDYRFLVRGRADPGGGVQDHETVSRAFRVERAALSLGQPTVSGGVARVREGTPTRARAPCWPCRASPGAARRCSR